MSRVCRIVESGSNVESTRTKCRDELAIAVSGRREVEDEANIGEKVK